MSKADSLSLTELARRLGRSKSGVHKLAAKGQIPRNSDGSFCEHDVRESLAGNLDPARRIHVHDRGEPANVVVKNEAEAREAVNFIARVLKEAGAEHTGAIDYNAARTAETILKARQREMQMAERRKELVPFARIKPHVDKAFIGLRQSIQKVPGRFGAEIAAECGCDPADLDRALSRALAMVLDELSTPMVRG